jgi:enoyl-CoA hydratase/carnithine racemase
VSRPVAQGLSLRIAEGVAWLRLERPQAGNRITVELAQALCDAIEAVELNDGVVVAVLEARGPNFCLGVENGGEWELRFDWIEAIARLTRPVVAAIQGDAVAEGFELALACDLRVASRRARFAMSQLAEGRLPVHGGTQRLPRIAGRPRALDLLLSGRMIDAAEAETMGVATRVAAPDALRRATARIVETLLTKGPIALRYAKEAVLASANLTLDQGMRLEEDLYVLLQTTEDRRAGVAAARRKRRPAFRGR